MTVETVETVETEVTVEIGVTVETVETRVTEETGVTGDTGQIINIYSKQDYVITMLYDDVMRRKVTQRRTQYIQSIKPRAEQSRARTDRGHALLFQPCQFIMEHARLISIAQKVIHTFGKDHQLTLCCAVYSRARSITLEAGKVRGLFKGAN